MEGNNLTPGDEFFRLPLNTLTLERLNDLSLIEPVRIGLSATVSPLDEIAKFLVGVGRECLIADVKMVKEIEINLEFPGKHILEAETPALRDARLTLVAIVRGQLELGLGFLGIAVLEEM